MAGKPAQGGDLRASASPGAEPSEGERSAAGSAAAPSSASASSKERFGPLELTRMVKPDGRALIVYARVEAPS